MISKIESQNKKLFLISIFSLIIFVIAQILLFTTLTSSSLRQFEKITEIGANLEKTTSFPLNIGLIATVAVFWLVVLILWITMLVLKISLILKLSNLDSQLILEEDKTKYWMVTNNVGLTKVLLILSIFILPSILVFISYFKIKDIIKKLKLFGFQEQIKHQN
ncbi:unknown; predicted coding region [Mycoplasmopsis pulmonis]|uniref:Uncharacterized protein n=2 Tax=Mycoplasmopsis pulmonis TaxID=2107 RepID=Q98RH9_MYCPU|nr:hypothetical protein [Mycoplasmopsis pulmonis]CAC13203.1 unknown; predicted coding region [Mycoplasmopsis pulmonis]VEU67822.1 Uncharacterised protein [Mycoplasmopsis pulmonis]